MARQLQAAYAVGSTVLTVGASSTLYIPTLPGLASSLLKYASGGSVSIVGVSTQAVGEGYVLGAEALEINGPAPFFLAAGGATATVMLFKSFTEGSTAS